MSNSRLQLKRHHHWSGHEWIEVVETNPRTLADVGYQVVASAMGAVLRKAFDDHIRSCPSCLVPDRPLFDCPEAKRLFYLQPEGDTVIIG